MTDLGLIHYNPILHLKKKLGVNGLKWIKLVFFYRKGN